MLISAIKFEIHNVKAQFHGEFLIEDTIENQEKVFTHHFTRDIQFVTFQDFDFAKKVNYPTEMIPFHTELENEIDPIDEMTGCFA